MENFILPNNAEAEKAVIGAMFLDQHKSLPHCHSLNEDVFYKESYRNVFKVARKAAEGGRSVDLITIMAGLPAGTNPQDIYNLVETVPSACGIESHIKILKENYQLRCLYQVVAKNYSKVLAKNLTVNEFLQSQRTTVEELAFDEESFSLKETVLSTVRGLGDKSTAGIPTGFFKLDNKIGGLIPSNLVVIGGRPSMGKTSLAVSIMSRLSKEGKRPLFFSLEMSKDQIIRRILSMRSGVNLEAMKNGTITKEERSKITEKAGILSTEGLLINDQGGLRLSDLRQAALMYHAKKPLSAIFIDYLQLMSHHQVHGDTEAKSIGETTKGLKSLAKELNIPVVLLSQLSRELEKRPEKRPQMSDLRGSGSIEQDADIVIFPYRPGHYNISEDDELFIAKHRDGGIGKVLVDWVPHLAMFQNKFY